MIVETLSLLFVPPTEGGGMGISMKNLINFILEKAKKFKKHRILWQSILSMMIVLVLVTNTIYSDGLWGLFDYSSDCVVEAEEVAPEFLNSYPKTMFSNNTDNFSPDDDGRKKFIAYCYYYNTDDTFADAHKSDTLNVNFLILVLSPGLLAWEMQHILLPGQSVSSVPHPQIWHYRERYLHMLVQMQKL